MNEKEYLQQIIELQKQVIELQKQLAEKNITPMPFSYSPLINTTVCNHEYPSPWYGVIPPACKKCGQYAQTLTVTC